MTAEHEEWRAVVEWEDRYRVSNMGRVKALATERSNGWGTYVQPERIMGQSSNVRNQYMHVMFRRDKKSYCKSVHRLVLEAFAGPCPEGFEACHNNGDRTDNRLSNLRWDSKESNRADMKNHGTVYQYDKTHCPNGHRLEPPNLSPWALRGRKGKKPYRRCRSCDRARSRIYDNPHLKPHFQEVADSYYAQTMGDAS